MYKNTKKKKYNLFEKCGLAHSHEHFTLNLNLFTELLLHHYINQTDEQNIGLNCHATYVLDNDIL